MMKLKTFVKLTMWGLIMVSMGLTSGTAQARTLEEILKDKGVITTEDYAEAEKSNLVRYQPGKGLIAATADGNYKIQIGGYVQLLYKYTDYEGNKNNTSDFDIRRFKLQIQGNIFNKNLGYKFQGDVKDGMTTEDAFLNYKFGEPITVQVGQFKPPQARQELTSASRQLFPERSLANDYFNLGRDQGVQAAGSFAEKLVQYRVGFFNGVGPNTNNPDNRFMYTGRLDINPMGAYKMDEAGWPSEKPLVNIGSSFAWERVGYRDADAFDRDNDVLDKALGLKAYTNQTVFEGAFGKDLDWLLWTANLNATWMGATFAAEYYDLNADPDEGSDWDADGYYVQAGYQILPETLELGIRYSEAKSTDNDASANFDKTDTQLGINYYWNKHDLKVQADYTWSDDDWNDDNDEQIARLQVQFKY